MSGTLEVSELVRRLSPFEQLGPVVRKPVNANPGLKVNQGSYFSCQKEFSKVNLIGLLIASKVKI